MHSCQGNASKFFNDAQQGDASLIVVSFSSFVYHRLILSTQSVGAMLWQWRSQGGGHGGHAHQTFGKWVFSPINLCCYVLLMCK